MAELSPEEIQLRANQVTDEVNISQAKNVFPCADEVKSSQFKEIYLELRHYS